MPVADLGLAAIADAGPLIHLDQLGSLHLLAGFKEVLVPPVVAEEASRHRPGWDERAPSIVHAEAPSEERLSQVREQAGQERLDPGEIAALALWLEHRDATLLCDDLPARRHAEAMGCAVAGTLGILLWAARSGALPLDEARRLIAAIPQRTRLHIRVSLIEAALASLEE